MAQKAVCCITPFDLKRNLYSWLGQLHVDASVGRGGAKQRATSKVGTAYNRAPAVQGRFAYRAVRTFLSIWWAMPTLRLASCADHPGAIRRRVGWGIAHRLNRKFRICGADDFE